MARPPHSPVIGTHRPQTDQPSTDATEEQQVSRNAGAVLRTFTDSLLTFIIVLALLYFLHSTGAILATVIMLAYAWHNWQQFQRAWIAGRMAEHERGQQSHPPQF